MKAKAINVRKLRRILNKFRSGSQMFHISTRSPESGLTCKEISEDKLKSFWKNSIFVFRFGLLDDYIKNKFWIKRSRLNPYQIHLITPCIGFPCRTEKF